MCKELKMELEFGHEAAKRLVGHLVDMGAAKGIIPVGLLDKNFIVTVEQVHPDKDQPHKPCTDEHMCVGCHAGTGCTNRVCCHVGCNKPAVFEIYDNNDSRPDGSGITDACEDHVGTLLGSVPPVNPAGPWTVVSIVKKGG